ncbi:Nop domain-containing protein [Metschnikowia bicuspidata var. bicuspidata NRRL YB-4993]|uniref:Nop domain-containing protein n=1 Tax=Metschnikowia bicuspidata var. bicuspidata NRRL YB-4993 TaxID=869754 RepID=A0A1A0HFA9_9ASCO|nr:Nop domain-containing protein [Metschnikowia bicuspidata var. bicuspidata NRRL YB-4993]OBA22681.1 Nop domain-containing protein [Metschnikowia bicuspidata var. bicuspidata NRRL YB-4993]
MDALSALGALDTSGALGLSQVQALIPVIRADLEKYADLMETEYMDLVASIHQQDQSAEYRFLVQLSDLPVLVHDEMLALRRFVALRYQVVFPELELLVASPVDYCRVVLEIGQDLAGVRAHEPRLRQIVAADKVLTIVMAALQQFPQAFQLSPGDFAPIAAACHACLELSGFLQEISQFVAGKLGKYAPNVAQVVGPVATAQLLVSTGSLAQLAQTPACNLAALGVRELLSQHKARLAPWVRAPGYLYQSPLVAGLPPEIVRQALRVISAKVVLAARIDLSRSSPDGGMGRAYRDEIRRKIDQLLAPPELTAARALPVPKEQKLKKRGGRRFRKMKERFQMSDLRKAQNKMLFGTQEQTVMDGFGDEVGLGMSRQMDGVLVNRNTDARMSKAMVARLQQQKQRETLDTIVLAPVAEKRARAPDVPGKWGTMKRQRLDGEDRG